jgi:hypothetical protein
MTNLPQPSEHRAPAELRASDADREAVAERLREAAGDGRLDLEELDERLDRAFAAKTYGELAPLTADLPAGPAGTASAAPAPAAQEDQPPLVIKGGAAGDSRKGPWTVPRRIRASGGVGGVKLDFTQARLRGPVVDVEAHGDMGGVTLVVPEGWQVELAHSEAGMGGVKNKALTEPRQGAPLLRAVCAGGMGGVTIRHANWWERRRLRRQQAG